MTYALLRRWWRLPRAERVFAGHVWLLLAVCQAALGWFSLEKVLAGRVHVLGARCLTQARILFIVQAVAANHPFRPQCLAQALVARWALRQLGVRTDMVIGCARTTPFEAHAWLQAGGAIVMGADPAGRYRELHVFAETAG